jgi:hypothetical protein
VLASGLAFDVGCLFLAAWVLRMNPRDPLTLVYARTVRETRRDPYDFWEGPVDIEPRRKLKSSVIPTIPPLWVRALRALFSRYMK